MPVDREAIKRRLQQSGVKFTDTPHGRNIDTGRVKITHGPHGKDIDTGHVRITHGPGGKNISIGGKSYIENGKPAGWLTQRASQAGSANASTTVRNVQNTGSNQRTVVRTGTRGQTGQRQSAMHQAAFRRLRGYRRRMRDTRTR